MAPHPFSWWDENPNRQKFLRDVLRELPPDEDPEDEQGKPRYVAKLCPEYQAYKKKLEKECREKNKERERYIEFNSTAKQKGKRPMDVPPVAVVDASLLKNFEKDMAVKFVVRKQEEKVRENP